MSTHPNHTDVINNDLDHIDWIINGMESILNSDSTTFSSMVGNENYYCLHFDMNKIAGQEDKFSDAIKKGAQTLYNSLTEMLKKINTYFFGDAQKTAESALSNAQEALAALDSMDGNTPVPEDSPARNPENVIKALEGGVEFNEVMDENNELKSAISKVKATADKVRNSDTVAKLKVVYADIIQSLNQGIQSVSGVMRNVLSAAGAAANKLRTSKIPKEDDTPEIKAGMKEENKQTSDEAKEETKKARIIGGVQNKLTSGLGALSSLIKTVKNKPVKSNFKG